MIFQVNLIHVYLPKSMLVVFLREVLYIKWSIIVLNGISSTYFYYPSSEEPVLSGNRVTPSGCPPGTGLNL